MRRAVILPVFGIFSQIFINLCQQLAGHSCLPAAGDADMRKRAGVEAAGVLMHGKQSKKTAIAEAGNRW